MSRRRALSVGLVILCSLAVLVHAGSFSTTSAGRDVRVNVVSDDRAYLGVSASRLGSGPKVSLGVAGDDDRGHGNDCGGYDPDNPGASDGLPERATREVNVTIDVENRFPGRTIVRVEVGSESRSAGVDAGEIGHFSFTNVSRSSDVVVEADGVDTSVSADVHRVLCTVASST